MATARPCGRGHPQPGAAPRGQVERLAFARRPAACRQNDSGQQHSRAASPRAVQGFHGGAWAGCPNGGTEGDGSRQDRVWLLRIVTGAMGWLLCGPAEGGTRRWMPRRHHRRLGEKWDARQYSGEVEEGIDRKAGVQQQNAQAIWQSWMAGHQSKSGTRSKELILTATAPMQTHEVLGAGTAYGARDGYAGLAWIAAVIVLSVAIIPTIAGKINAQLRRKKGGNRGRWVADRSLGGRQVFVPAPGGYQGLNPLDTGERARRAESAQQMTPAARMPQWWSIPPSIYVPESVKQEAAKGARLLLQRLANAKVDGQDYALGTVLELFKTCQSGSVRISGRSENIALSVFRAGALWAIDSAADRAQVGGIPPNQFVAGLADYLNLDEQKAVDVMLGMVASRARALILEVAVDMRSHRGDTLYPSGLTKLVNLVGAFPLQTESGHAELIASSLKESTTDEERRELHTVVKALHPNEAPSIGEMVGIGTEPGVQTVGDSIKE